MNEAVKTFRAETKEFQVYVVQAGSYDEAVNKLIAKKLITDFTGRDGMPSTNLLYIKEVDEQIVL